MNVMVLAKGAKFIFTPLTPSRAKREH